jgi:hypothetical protein
MVIVTLTFLALALRSASAELHKTFSDWVEMPDGKFYHKACVHHHDETFHADTLPNGRGTKLTKNGISSILPPCPFPVRSRHEQYHVQGKDSYYSDWSVYAQTVAQEYTYMNSTWTVPANPSSRGPLGLSSVYLFNGLEDGSGHHGNASLILQPVLQFGKSGCLLNPLDWGSWNIAAYLVDGNGRAHCGKTIKVQTNDTVVGVMKQTNAETNVWEVSASSGGSTSTFTTSLGEKVVDAAYLTLEGMVIYNCKTYPPGGGVTFTNISLNTINGPIKNSKWEPEIRHSECKQDVSVISNDQVELLWSSDA